MGVTVAQFDTAQAPRVFESRRAAADPGVLAELALRIQSVDLAAPVVVLPDFHHKRDMEMPSSIVVATRKHIRPTLTSSSVNCGMALIALDMDRPNDKAIGAFFRGVRERYPYPRTLRRELGLADVVRCAAEGAHFAVERYGVDPAELERIEEGGRLDVDPFGGAEAIRRELPWITLQLSRMRFGSIGPSNHFIEIQEVEEILDGEAAAQLGVHRGQMTLQYHGGGGTLAGLLGRLFGRRRKASRSQRLQIAVQKPLYHLASARSLTELQQRLSLYFSGGFPPVPRDGTEGRRLMLANHAAMNYGFAFRLATYASLRALAHEFFGARRSRLIVDSPHNSIYEEEVSGERALVHRHNACRAWPSSMFPKESAFGRVGQALLLPGTHRTSSYLCVAGSGAFRSLYSACHGTGTLIERFVREGTSGPDPAGRTTLRFRYSDADPEPVPQLDDRGIEEALNVLRADDLVRPVARMRPVAVLN
jgi:tRNA-splicing ligase RtcB